MLNNLKFAQGAIKKNNINPELEYYQIKGGRVVGYNGFMALSSPIPLDIEAKPKADLFYKALNACGDAVSIDLTPAGRLHIKSGRFSAYVPCIDKEIYEVSPQGETFEAPPGLAQAFKRMLPFISEDASRPWAMGLLIDGGCLTATNNIIIIQEWIGHQLPTMNCPRFAVAEVVRIGRDPVSIQVSPSSLVFHYDDGSWLYTQTLGSEWPVDKMNEIMSAESVQMPIHPEFFGAVEDLAPFILEGHFSGVYFEDGSLTSAPKGAQEGARIEIEGLKAGPVFHVKALQLLSGLVDTIDWGLYPRPCIFYGKNIRGAVIGLNP